MSLSPIRRFRQIRRRVVKKYSKSASSPRLVLAMVVSSLDYCNAALAGLPQATVAPLQRVQNSAAYLIFNVSTLEPVTPCLLHLRWLPFTRRRYTLSLLRTCPAYLTNIGESLGSGRTRFSIVDRLCSAMAARKDRWECVLIRRSLCMERASTWRFADPAEFRKQPKTDYFNTQWLLILWFYYFALGLGCEVLRSTCLYLCLFVHLSARMSRKQHIQTSRHFLVHVTRGRGSVFLWHQCSTYFRLCEWRHDFI